MNKPSQWVAERLRAWWQRVRASLRLRQGSAPAVDAPAIAARPVEEPAAMAMPMLRYATVVIPALNEARRIADVVAYVLADEATAEVIVIDDSSIDDTARLARQAGARVITSTMLGKGASMGDGGSRRQGGPACLPGRRPVGLRPGIITDLCRPLLRGQADFVKARFGRGGGRVTELTAKPMLKVFFPEVAHFAQPLGGIVAARRSLLRSLSFRRPVTAWTSACWSTRSAPAPAWPKWTSARSSTTASPCWT
jgi:glucosyl-3-phosphoglycerate synthase